MDRSNRQYKKSGKFRNMLQHGDHILLGTLETNVNLDQTWVPACTSLVPFGAFPSREAFVSPLPKGPRAICDDSPGLDTHEQENVQESGERVQHGGRKDAEPSEGREDAEPSDLFLSFFGNNSAEPFSEDDPIYNIKSPSSLHNVFPASSRPLNVDGKMIGSHRRSWVAFGRPALPSTLFLLISYYITVPFPPQINHVSFSFARLDIFPHSLFATFSFDSDQYELKHIGATTGAVVFYVKAV
jgi:hypothetical protein